MSNSSEQVKSRIIEPVSIQIEERSGYEVLVVEDSAGNQYTTLRDGLVEEIPEEKEKYLGSPWRIKWSLTEEGFLNFHGFEERVDGEPSQEKIDKTSSRDRSITRQSAGHDAARIVSGKLASGERLSDEDIARELKKWTDYIKRYYRTGEWKR